jgi:hypothetical protein
MLNLCGIVVAILKMTTARNFSMSGINFGHHNLPTYEMSLKSDNVEFVPNSTLSDFNDISYVGRLWCPKFIPDIEKFLAVVIFKMATTIPHKFNIVRFQRHFICGYYPHMKCRWNRTMLNLCGIVVAILKMVTARNFLMSGINSGHHNLPTYEMSLKSDNVEFVCKMATKIQHCPISSKFDMWVDYDVRIYSRHWKFF